MFSERMPTAIVFDCFNYEVGIMNPDSYREELRGRNKIFDFPITKFPLRSRNKIFDFPITKFQEFGTTLPLKEVPDSNTSQYSSLGLKGRVSKHDSCFQ